MIFSTFFFLNFAKKTHDIFKEVFQQLLAYFSILHRRPRMFRKVSAICRFFFILQRRPRMFKEFFWQFLEYFSILPRRPRMFMEVFQQFLEYFKVFQRRPSIFKEFLMEISGLFSFLP